MVENVASNVVGNLIWKGFGLLGAFCAGALGWNLSGIGNSLPELWETIDFALLIGLVTTVIVVIFANALCEIWRGKSSYVDIGTSILVLLAVAAFGLWAGLTLATSPMLDRVAMIIGLVVGFILQIVLACHSSQRRDDQIPAAVIVMMVFAVSFTSYIALDTFRPNWIFSLL
ncbi:MAG: hypothetical protein OXE17_16435 [Chloroflexi bacterium]|nr:hypothetical protein [Chloroflexota bacterium]